MDHFIDITILDHPEVSTRFLMEKSYAILHGVFSQVGGPSGVVPCGVSFPGYSAGTFELGSTLRVHGAAADLEQLALDVSFQRLSDYVQVSPLRRVPEKVTGYAHFYRLRGKPTKEALARRKAKRFGLHDGPNAEVLQALDGYQQRRPKAPYVRLSSNSTGQRYDLAIGVQPAETQVLNGFNAFGLSKLSTVPLF